MRQLVDAASEMHSKGIFHQDIKTDNIIIENSAERLANWCVKYIDFGCGAIFTPEAVTRRNGRSSASLFLPPQRIVHINFLPLIIYLSGF